jgi:23S rRNA (uracil747-C5)-methyltransferase
VSACHYFDQALCRSCSQLLIPYQQQLRVKQTQAGQLLHTVPERAWQSPVASTTFGFRNKAKVAVGGSIGNVSLGLLDQHRQVDLSECPLYPKALHHALATIKQWLNQHQFAPYELAARRGELKFLIISINQHDELMLRIVLRSRAEVDRIAKHATQLHAMLGKLSVLSINLQPTHAAILEGREELALFGEALTFELNSIPMQVPPQAFFQTNSTIAEQLYAKARDALLERGARRLLDLFCGVGGFALHAAVAGIQAHGVELSELAVRGAQQTVRRLETGKLGSIPAIFQAADAETALALLEQDFDAVVVNPPRRGIGLALAGAINASRTRWLCYSSCNPESLARDLRALSTFVPERAQLFDMFPNTEHSEVMVMLRRAG